jgi:2-keto-4-pentenoate hydratase/2-oxohepta-3-ene-1,7-dioic acid hydratase in catechol pathway
MKLVRFTAKEWSDTDTPQWGILEDEEIQFLSEEPFAGIFREEKACPASGARLLPPVRPGKVVCVGYNYIGHIEEMGQQVPDEPLLFLKASSAIVGNGENILLPPESERVDYEGELAVVIGTRCRRVSTSDAERVILGYTILNDVTARDLQRKDGQFSRGKSFDTFCPLGPWIETDLDPSETDIVTRVNGEIRQDAAVSSMIFSSAFLVSYVSQAMTLEPGDVIATGTPAGVGPLAEGDEVSISVDGLGVLANPVRSEQDR